MPDDQRDFDKNIHSVHQWPPIMYLNNTHKNIDVEETRDTNNWNSSSQTDVSYVSLLIPEDDDNNYSSNNCPASDQNILTSPADSSQFCCCSSEARQNLGSCWKSKRRQIIRESAHASAKNRAKSTTSICRKRTTKATTTTATTTAKTHATKEPTIGIKTIKQSLLPRRNCPLNRITATTITTPTTTKLTTRSESLRQSLNAFSKINSIVNNGQEVVNASISLPATPNLSQLRRRQYKKLSLKDEEDYAASVSIQQLQLLQRKDFKQLQLTQRQQTIDPAPWQRVPTTALVIRSEVVTLTHTAITLAKESTVPATATTLTLIPTPATATTLAATANSIRATADHSNEIHQQPSMLRTHELIAIHALPAATTTTTTTTSVSKKIPACNAHFVAKNNINISSSNNINNNNNNNNNISNNKSSHDRIEKNIDSLSIVSNGHQPTQAQTARELLGSGKDAKAIAMTTTTKATTAPTTMTTTAAIASTKTSLAFCENCCESASTMSGNSFSSINNDHNAEAARLFSPDIDSVSDELSSFRLISEEEESNRSAFCDATTRTREFIPASNSVFSEQVTHHQPTVTTTSVESASICCFVECASQSVANQAYRPSAPFSTHSITFNEADEAFRSRANSGYLSSSLPNDCTSLAGIGSGISNSNGYAISRTSVDNCHPYCIASQQSAVRGKLALPPTPPPKPRRDLPAVSNVKNQPSSANRSCYDPTSFRRKLQKFEQQTASLSPTNTATRLCDEEHTECSSPEPCELLNCFGSSKNIRERERERAAVARSSSESSCGDATAAISVSSYSECVSNSVGDSDHKYENIVAPYVDVGSLEKSIETNNNNYNCKIIVCNHSNKKHFGSSPNILNRRTLRYDNCGRLKIDGATNATATSAFQQPKINSFEIAKKSLSVSRLPLRNSCATNCAGGGFTDGDKAQKFTPTLCRKLNFEGIVAKSVATSNSEDLTPIILSPLNPRLSPLPPTSPKSPKSPKAQHSPKSPLNSNVSRIQSANDLGNVAEVSRENKLLISFSETHNRPVRVNTIEAGTISPKVQQKQYEHQLQHTCHQQKQQQQQRSYSDHTLKSCNYFKDAADICQCVTEKKSLAEEIGTTTTTTTTIIATTTTTRTDISTRTRALSTGTAISAISTVQSDAKALAGTLSCIDNKSSSSTLVHHQNSLAYVSLPNVPQSNGSQSPLWLSSETIASSRSELKCLDDTRSNCSDQTTIFHLEHDYSSSSSPLSSQSCGVGGTCSVGLRGPILLRRIPEIQSFGNLEPLANPNAQRDQTEFSMEKRRNTLDRFQRLGFGRKSASSPVQVAEGSGNASTKQRKSAQKSEKLKELTELLRGNRSSPTPTPTPPPMPPPRKPRIGSYSQSNSFEKPDKVLAASSPVKPSIASVSDSMLLSLVSVQTDDILLMDADETSAIEEVQGEQQAKEQNVNTSNNVSKIMLDPSVLTFNCPDNSLGKTNTNNPPRTLDLSKTAGCRENGKYPASNTEIDLKAVVSTEIGTKLTRPESRIVIGSYTQKGIPFRSASFSQIDYSSGKYKKSALSLLRERLRRDKAVDRTPSPNGLNMEKPEDDQPVSIEQEPMKKEPDWIHIPLKRLEVNADSDIKLLEDVAESPDAIIEEDVFDVEKGLRTVSESETQLKHNSFEASQVTHAQMESLSDTIASENDNAADEEQPPITVKSNSLIDSEIPANELGNECSLEREREAETDLVESNLATLIEEEMQLESPPDNFLQTATTCLIPVPVYECAAQDWRLENPPAEWVEVASEEFGIVPETMQPLVAMDQCSVAQSEAVADTDQKTDPIPTISVRRSSEEEEDEHEPNESEILRKKSDFDNLSILSDRGKTLERRQASLDYPEVKKRYSQDDIDLAIEKRSSLDSIATRFSAEERKRLDKSRRRKGVYIESTDWGDDAAANSRGLALDITIANLNAIKDHSQDECPSLVYLNSSATDDNNTPGSLYSLDLNTPDSECNKPPVWTKSQRLISFSCQSSEEKDEAQSTGSGHSATRDPYFAGGTILSRHCKTYPFLRTDSISDNESDRTPPPSRDRTSASSSLSENDFKRYSKRPLRGPYGQMLEAEMKKPNKMHFEEILEELRESSEGLPSQPHRRQCATASEDDRGREEDVGELAAGGSGRHVPQYSNSVRVRKTNTYLPVPLHARAASTPSQIENVNRSSSSNSSKNQINSSNKQQIAPSQSPPQTNTHHNLREMKRAASEAPTMKPHHSKRSQSMSGEKPTHHLYQPQNQQQNQQQNQHHSHQQQQKHSLDIKSSISNSTDAAGEGRGGHKQKNVTNLMPTPQLLAELLKGSSEKLLSEQRQQVLADTRTHVVQEIFKNEQSYVESLQTVVLKYLKVLKSPENAGMIDSRTVDEIFFMVPDILDIHEKFLAELRARLDNWNTQQKVGDAFMETFSKLEVLEVYTSFVNNCNRAKNAIRSTKHQRPSFSKFLETTAREHKGKLTLDNLLIKPVQKFPNYEMLFTRLIKHTDHDHPDQKHLQDVLKLVHDILVHINCKEREILENGQREAILRELEGVIEGVTDLFAPDRQFLLFDLVSVPSGQGARKERGFFLFNDLLVLTSIKKRSGTIRKPNTSTCPGTVASTLDTNKYKFLTKISLDCLEIVKTKDENLKRIMSEIENLAEDCNKLQQITEITASLRYPHQYLEDVVRELHRDVQRQLSERQTNDAQLNMLELAVNSPNGSQKLSIVFSKAEKRSQWEKIFNEAKQKLAATLERHPIPEFLTSIPIRKTRAGLQFTCAAPTLSEKRDVWVCNSDGYVGQVCIMSLYPEPNVTSCNGVCNARILCVASVPAYCGSSSSSPDPRRANRHQQRDCRKSNSPSGSNAIATQEDRRKQMSNISIATSGIGGSVGSGSVGSFGFSTNNNHNANNNNNNNNNNTDTHLDLNSSSSDDDTDAAALIAGASGGVGMLNERIPSPSFSIHTPASTSTSTASSASTTVMGLHQQQDSNPDEGDGNQSTMWIGTEDGCIHVYNSTDNIRIKKNRIKIEHHSAVYSILYLDNRVFVSLANGDICVYLRDGVGWNTSSSQCVSMGTVSNPVTKLLNVHGKLWCSIQGFIKVLDVETLLVVNEIQISSDSKPITNMTACNSFVWISIQNSAHIKCFHSISHHLITEVNLAPAVNKMLSNCDEIIRQHKAACLRVTSLLSCKDLIWIGTSAGVLLTIPAQGYEKGVQNIVPTGIPHGHTGHVRFLTYVETSTSRQLNCSTLSTTDTTGGKDRDNATGTTTTSTTTTTSINAELKSSNKSAKTKSEESNNILIISGGDGYEDFRNSGANSLSEIAGREDSTNHLLIWQI